MVFDRTYKPNDEQIIYHYCSPSTFNAICTYKKIRLSDVFSMNDFMEMHWGYNVWKYAVENLSNQIDQDLLNTINENVSIASRDTLLLALCFSTKGDLLSQWRGYADDGKGYAIGFKAKDLHFNLSGFFVRFLRVLYDEEAQIEETKETIMKLQKEKQREKSEDFKSLCCSLAFNLAGYKNPAFAEEKEVRSIRFINYKGSNKYYKLTDPGGLPISFKMRNNTPVPYIELDFTYSGNINPIKEVIVGPKNDSKLKTISVFLETVGIGSVKVKKSKASYR